MTILGINTAEEFSQIALVSEQGILVENKWKAENNESELLLPEIIKMMESKKIKWEEIDKIFIVSGPGPFTALRVSISAANALAYGLNKPIIGMPLIDLWKCKYNGDIAIFAGQNRVFYNNELISFEQFLDSLETGKEISGFLKDNHIEMLKNKGIKWIDEKDLLSFGGIILDLIKKNFSGLSEKEIVEPLYFSAPVVTKSNKSYK